MNQDTHLKLTELRNKVAMGEHLTLEETREAITLIRGSRIQAASTSAKARTKKADTKAVVNSDDMLRELGI